MSDDYDFSDWELGGEDEDTLRNVVRGHLRELYAQIQKGEWDFCGWDEHLNPVPPHRCDMEWRWGGIDRGGIDRIEWPPLVTMRPAQLAGAIIEELQHIARDGMYSHAGDKDELRDCWQRFTAGWRAALDAVDEEAKRLLDLPSE